MNKEHIRFQDAITKLQSGEESIAFEELQNLAKNGFGHADAMLGSIYEFGRGKIEKNEDMAIEHYERATTSVGALEAWLGLGRIFMSGDERLRNYSKAFQCFFIVCEDADRPEAWLALGEFHLKGLGVEKDVRAAKECYQRAVDLGNVFGYTGLSEVARRERKWLKMIKYRLLAIGKTAKIVFRKPNHPSLRRI